MCSYLFLVFPRPPVPLLVFVFLLLRVRLYGPLTPDQLLVNGELDSSPSSSSFALDPCCIAVVRRSTGPAVASSAAVSTVVAVTTTPNGFRKTLEDEIKG